MKKRIWIVAQAEDKRMDATSLDVFHSARSLAAAGAHMEAAVFSARPVAVPEQCERLLLLPVQPCRSADTEGRILAEAIRTEQPDIVLAPATVWGRTVMSVAAALVQTGLTADCTSLELAEDGKLLQTRPAYGGKLLARIITPHSKPEMATLRVQNADLGAMTLGSARQCVRLEYKKEYIGAKLCTSVSEQDAALRGLLTSKIVVAGGLGLENRENFQVIYQIAEKLGGAVGASRAAVNAGFAPYACQIGQSGHTVSPEVYLAIGISGAVQHLAGMHGAKKVIAVNPDSKAPIFDHADIGILQDWKTFTEKLLSML